MAHHNDASYNDHAMNGVGAAHQGSVKNGGDKTDDLHSQEYSQEQDIDHIKEVKRGQKALNVREKNHKKKLDFYISDGSKCRKSSFKFSLLHHRMFAQQIRKCADPVLNPFDLIFLPIEGDLIDQQVFRFKIIITFINGKCLSM